MTEIELAFHPNLLPLIRDGKKICTTRRKQHGNIGDTFIIENTEFRIRDVHQSYLGTVRDHIYRLEGFPSPYGFQECWEYLYDCQLVEATIVFTHWFTPTRRLWDVDPS